MGKTIMHWEVHLQLGLEGDGLQFEAMLSAPMLHICCQFKWVINK